MKTLKEKRILDKEVPRAYYPEEDVKEFIKEILKEINEGIKLTIKFYKHKEGEELGAEIYNYLYKIIKQKSGFEEW